MRALGRSSHTYISLFYWPRAELIWQQSLLEMLVKKSAHPAPRKLNCLLVVHRAAVAAGLPKLLLSDARGQRK